MAIRYKCSNLRRLTLLRDHPTLNGIDYLDVLDDEAPAGSPRQRTLLVHFVKDIPATLDVENVRITGGTRILDVEVVWAFRADSIPAGELNAAEQTYFGGLANAARVLVVRTSTSGDYTAYTLHITETASSDEPPPDFDPILSSIAFSFKVDCPSDFDCMPVDVDIPTATATPPPIDYLARDFASLRQVMLDHLSSIAPDWQDRNLADWSMAVVDVLAYVGDYQHYHLDAVATEAYLDTARKRVSVRRHSRLLDYQLHEGCNARAWVTLEVEAGSAADGLPLPAGTRILTRVNAPDGTLNIAPADIPADALVFETLHPVTLHPNLYKLVFYTWGDDKCCLPRGATHATLKGTLATHPLSKGDVLIFEEVHGAKTGNPADANPDHRHVVRLKAAPQERTDPLTGEDVLEITWHEADALPFTLCLHDVEDSEGATVPVSLARGNAVLVDHGMSVDGDAPLPATVGEVADYRPRLEGRNITFAMPYEHETAQQQAASTVHVTDPRAALPVVNLNDGADDWFARLDLLESDRFDRHFVVEMDERDTAHLRFGDGILGMLPERGDSFTAAYRVGGGVDGNIGAESLAHVLTPHAGITTVRNPLPAWGGTAPESIEQAKLDAPQAFQTQRRAVTAEDYENVAREHPQVQDAKATLRWTGSWHTLFVTVDRIGGAAVDAAFETEIRRYLARFRLTGHDLEIEPPLAVPLEIKLRVCVMRGYFRDAVEQQLLTLFSSGLLANGQRGFFHPDNFTFGQTVYLSQIIAAAVSVPGVDYVEPLVFKRWHRPAAGEIKDGRIQLNRLEIARLDNDVNRPENGSIEFLLEAGL